jgi:hypothetical protein
MESTYSAFKGDTLLIQDTLPKVILKVKREIERGDRATFVIFSDMTGKVMDFDMRGTDKDVHKRLEVFISDADPRPANGPGRPKLGVVSREVSLLPRHWEWLATQSGGASAALRRLVEEARKKSDGSREIQEKTYRFMSVLGGNLPGFEEALRALYKRDEKPFLLHLKAWPPDVRRHVVKMAKGLFESPKKRV